MPVNHKHDLGPNKTRKVAFCEKISWRHDARLTDGLVSPKFSVFAGFDVFKFCQVKALTPLKQLMRSKGALKDQSRLIQHFSKRIANSQLSVQALKKAVFKKRYILIALFEKAK